MIVQWQSCMSSPQLRKLPNNSIRSFAIVTKRLEKCCRNVRQPYGKRNLLRQHCVNESPSKNAIWSNKQQPNAVRKSSKQSCVRTWLRPSKTTTTHKNASMPSRPQSRWWRPIPRALNTPLKHNREQNKKLVQHEQQKPRHA